LRFEAGNLAIAIEPKIDAVFANARPMSRSGQTFGHGADCRATV
jgi:hypothetical protein